MQTLPGLSWLGMKEHGIPARPTLSCVLIELEKPLRSLGLLDEQKGESCNIA